MLTYESQLPYLDRQVEATLARQVMDTGREEFGAFISDGMAPGTSISSATSLAYGYLCDGGAFYRREELVDRIKAACVFARKIRRPSGNYDLVTTNFDSSPDTGFIVEGMATAVKEARKVAKKGDAGAKVIAAELGEIIASAVPGMVTGGFHTPNHRWVLCAALTQAFALFPDLEGREVVDRYLDETIDCNEDGEFTERSTGVYNAVCNRALRLTAEALGRPELLDPVRRNLDMSYHLLHADGSVVTSISTRQDRGTRTIPLGLADSYYTLARLDDNGFYAAVADWLTDLQPGGPIWTLQPFLAHPEWREDPLKRESLPESYEKNYAASGIWRVRRGRASATVAKGLTAPFSLTVGDLQLTSVKVCASYFAVAQFEARDMESFDGGVRLHDPGRGSVHDSPGYYQPIGEPVSSAEWGAVRRNRPHRALPPFKMDLEITEIGRSGGERGFDIRVRTSEGMDHVPLQIEFDFAPGGEFDVAGGAVRAKAGQTFLLKAGYGIYRVGGDAVKIGPGHVTHRFWDMRGSESAPEAFRVLITHVSHIDEKIQIRYGTYSEVTEDLLNT